MPYRRDYKVTVVCSHVKNGNPLATWRDKREKDAITNCVTASFLLQRTLYCALKVPRAGVEPARVAPLVFETSASTDSAIWALA